MALLQYPVREIGPGVEVPVAATIDQVQIDAMREALAQRGITMEYYELGEQALARLKELVPLGIEVQTGSSTTLDQIGFTAWLTELHHAGHLRYFRAEVHHQGD